MIALWILAAFVAGQEGVVEPDSTAVACERDAPYATWSNWGDWSLIATASCNGHCGTGTKTISRTRVCCANTQEGDDPDDFDDNPLCEGDSSDEEESDCDLVPCEDSDGYREYDGYMCKMDTDADAKYVGYAGSAGQCEALVEAAHPSAEGYMLECIGSNDDHQAACYACFNSELDVSQCGSVTYIDPSYTWNYILIGLGFGGAVLVLAGAFAVHHFKLCGENEDWLKEKELHNKEDELDVPMGLEGGWCCCPDALDLNAMVVIMCLLGFGTGSCINLASVDMSEKAYDDWLELIYYPGELWVNALKLVVVPLIALMMAILPSRVDVTESRIGPHLLGFYIFTSCFAACEGLIWVNVIKPGDVDLYIVPENEPSVTNSLTELDALLGIGRKAIPNNIVGALASGNVLAIMIFFLGMGILMQQPAPIIADAWRDAFVNATKGALKAIMCIVPYLIMWTPVAMFCIVTNKIAGIDNLELLLQSEAKYLLTVVVAQGCHAFIFYPLLLFAISSMVSKPVNPYRYFNSIKKAPFTAFATSSSLATLPVTMETLKEHGVAFEIVDFVAPLGSAINMDGTSCGFPIMVMFTAQLKDITVDAGNQIVVALLAMTCSVGTAPIPNAGIVYLAMLFTAAGGELADEDTIAFGLSMILILDWFVDRVETAQNIWSDCVACKTFDTIPGYAEELKKKAESEMTTMKEKGGKREPMKEAAAADGTSTKPPLVV